MKMFFIFMLGFSNLVLAGQSPVALDFENSQWLFNHLTAQGVQSKDNAMMVQINTGRVVCGTFPNHGGSTIYSCTVLDQNLRFNGKAAQSLITLFRSIGVLGNIGPGSVLHEVSNIYCVAVSEFELYVGCTIDLEKKPKNPSGVSVGN